MRQGSTYKKGEGFHFNRLEMRLDQNRVKMKLQGASISGKVNWVIKIDAAWWPGLEVVQDALDEVEGEFIGNLSNGLVEHLLLGRVNIEEVRHGWELILKAVHVVEIVQSVHDLSAHLTISRRLFLGLLLRLFWCSLCCWSCSGCG